VGWLRMRTGKVVDTPLIVQVTRIYRTACPIT
jgi:hypothetical protein